MSYARILIDFELTVGVYAPVREFHHELDPAALLRLWVVARFVAHFRRLDAPHPIAAEAKVTLMSSSSHSRGRTNKRCSSADGRARRKRMTQERKK